ncbi:hypothetical protein CRENBAI_015580 [Crenichthys baileyi]|uniref:Uncharacterized protein n=1 Tax=Crenichthys baileyi TaxID=28760 RepID=A0AAV9R601_9TELE
MCGVTNPSGARQSHAKLLPPPQANATATPHILHNIGRGTVKTTNLKHTPPTRNHPADKQTPPQYKVEKPDATDEPSNARPAASTLGGQSRHTQNRRTNTTAHYTAEDRTQQRAPKAKVVHKAHTVHMCPHEPSENKAPTPAKVHPCEKKIHSIQV